jgi:homoserine O-succinyltransferase
VGSCNRIAQFYVHPFSVPGLSRSSSVQEYIDAHYTTFEKLKDEGLDALIITGANVANPSLEEEPFWEPLAEIVEWANEHVTSMLCSCLSTHALMKHFYNIDRQSLPAKKWGVYTHRVMKPDHPLLREINTRFDVPHSRHNAITREQFEQAGLTILIESDDGEVHMVVSPDQMRRIYFQGHPEYDMNSLLKEYKREVLRFLNDERDLPPYPEHYFTPEVEQIAEEYIEEAHTAKRGGCPLPPFPEARILPLLNNTWGDTGKAVFNNWLGLVYSLTHVDRRKLFDDGIDPNDPLGIRNQ